MEASCVCTLHDENRFKITCVISPLHRMHCESLALSSGSVAMVIKINEQKFIMEEVVGDNSLLYVPIKSCCTGDIVTIYNNEFRAS